MARISKSNESNMKKKTKKSDFKATISRSYSRKLNLGNYEVSDYFAAYSMEIPVGSSEEVYKNTSESLYNSARLDVENAIVQSIDSDRPLLDKLIDQAEFGEPIELSEYIKVTESPYATYLINEAKKKHKRSAEYKEKLKPRN